MTLQPFKLAFLDDPYASPFLLKTLGKLNIPIVATPKALSIAGSENLVFISEEDARNEILKSEQPLLYTHSENSLSWIKNNIGSSDIASIVKIYKNKILFRELLQDVYPDFFFQAVKLSEIDKVDFSKLPKPFVIKPAVGFLSLGVYTVSNQNEWEIVRNRIKTDSSAISKLYPDNVLDITTFIIEESIVGDEYAFDCYFDNLGQPVILGIYKHLFASDEDVSDRVYITSNDIIQEMLKPINDFLNKLGEKIDLKNFPMHVEIRIDDKQMVKPIEVNPLRFGGWCTTADMTAMCYGINSYEYYFYQKKPDWNGILSNGDTHIYSIIVLDNKSGIDLNTINSFDYKSLTDKFEHPMEIRNVDFRKHPLFGFLFTKTRADNMEEIKYILKSDLREYISI